MHVGRDRAGARRLEEIAVLGRGHDGLVAATTAWRADRGLGDGMDRLTGLVSARRP